MEELTYLRKLISTSAKFDIAAYSQNDFTREFVAFEGTPRKHPHDVSRVLLLADPFQAHASFFEFPVDSVAHIEEIGTISSPDGKSIYKIRIWVKRGVVAIEHRPFVVDDQSLSDGK